MKNNDFESVNAFKKRMKIGLSADKIKTLALSSNLEAEEKISYKFKNLDSLIFDNSLSCRFTAKKTISKKVLVRVVNDNGTLSEQIEVNKTEVVEAKDTKQFLYMMKISKKDGSDTKVVKIGISSNVKKRVNELNLSWKGIAIFSILIVSEVKRRDMVKIESSIHTVLKANGLQYVKKLSLDGGTELFYYQEWYKNFFNIKEEPSVMAW